MSVFNALKSRLKNISNQNSLPADIQKGKTRQKDLIVSAEINIEPEVSDETGALLVYSCFITYKKFSHRPIN